MNPRPGEVWLTDLGLAAKTRPVVIVSRYDANAPRALVIYVPLTSENRGSEYEVTTSKAALSAAAIRRRDSFPAPPQTGAGLT